METIDSFTTEPEAVIHFVADTGPLLKPRAPSVVTVHGVASRWISTARNRVQESIWRARVGAAIRLSDRVITVSQSSADDIADVFDVSRDAISVIPHGIARSKFSSGSNVSAELESMLPQEFILYLGNIEPRKNLIQLVRAVEENDALPILVIAGKPAWNYTESMDIISRARRTRYIGFVSDADRAALMKRCAAFVFPSLYEGFGFPVLEAMAAGAPVITTDRGSLKEVAGPARILEGTDNEAIGAGIEAALNDERWMRSAPSAGQAWAGSFSWEESVKQHINVYREVMK
ncbi:glycosyltransferase family 4 protein [Pseudarthrobacter sp. NPDC092202]